MTTFLLIRHAAHDLLGKVLVGRAPGVHLNARGKMQAELLADRLATRRIGHLYTSPQERAQETAWPLAARLELTATVLRGLDEIDFGEWTALSFSELEPRPEWRRWNEARGSALCPGGETMMTAQKRISSELERLAATHSGETVAVVSHGDLIKAALMHFLGLPLDAISRFEVSPGSVSTVLHYDSQNAVVLAINEYREDFT